MTSCVRTVSRQVFESTPEELALDKKITLFFFFVKREIAATFVLFVLSILVSNAYTVCVFRHMAGVWSEKKGVNRVGELNSR